jgi:hypothetical protein
MFSFKIKLSLFFLLFLSCKLQSQYAWPVDSPLAITGTYGEIRPNHFHAGIDFSTNGKINLPVYAAQDGYVSRIRISPVGYGKSLYITHPDGLVTVYAHLTSFSPSIDEFIMKKMYEQQVNEIDFYTEPHTLKVKRKEVVALSGNSGGSTGPHVHFEIRDEKTEMPYNPLKHFSLKDREPPTLTNFAFYDLSDTCVPAFITTLRVRTIKKDSAAFERDHITLKHAIIGVAFAGLDRLLPGGNAGNVHDVRLYLDGKMFYRHHLSEISFNESRYINEYCQTLLRTKFQRCFMPTIFPASMYSHVTNKGRILLADTLYHLLKIELYDEADNRTTAQVWIRASEFNFFRSHLDPKSTVNCVTGSTIVQNGVSLCIPPRALYNSATVKLDNKIPASNTVFISSTSLNLALTMQLSLPIPEKLQRVKQKVVLFGSGISATGSPRNDSLIFNFKSFGKFTLLVDTVAPSAKIIHIPPSRRSALKTEAVAFYIKDNLSGVGQYKLFLNDRWVWGDYDAKSNSVSFTFEPTDPKGIVNFKLEISDRVGNMKTYYFLHRR